MTGVGGGILAEEIGSIAGYGQRPGIAHGVQQHVQRVAADVAHGADAAGLLVDECGAVRGRDAGPAAAAGLDIVNLAQLAGIYDLLDALHVGAHSGLEADGEDFAALLLGAHDFHGFVHGNGKGLLQHDMDTVLQCVDGAGSVLTVIGADTDGIQFLCLQHGVSAFIAADALQLIGLAELLGLGGNQVSGGYDFLRNPAGADDAYFYFHAGIDFGLLVIDVFKTVQNVFAHGMLSFSIFI